MNNSKEQEKNMAQDQDRPCLDGVPFWHCFDKDVMARTVDFAL